MLANFVGPVDFNSALVLVAAIVCFGIIVTSLIVHHRSRADIELAKLKQKSDAARAMYEAETERSHKFKQIEQNLITSHERVNDD